MEIVGYILAILVGISLGLIGGGGSILTLPILVYLFAIKPDVATTYSLFIVGISALVSSISHHKQGNLQLSAATYFGFPALISLLLIRKYILPKIPDILFQINELNITKNVVLMIVFAILMITASVSMIQKNNIIQTKHPIQKTKLIILGFLTGLLTGFLGAGGGFLIIPALVFFASFEMKKAIGTSLLIIAINSLIGFASDIINGAHINIGLLFAFSGLAIVGIFLGMYISKKINGNVLKPIFGWFVLVMGIFIIVQEIFLNYL